MISATQTKHTLTICAGTLEVRLASSFVEIDAAKRLRFEVFNLELREGLSASYDRGFDTDAYDAYCDHLIVKDLSLDKVVGTYRLLRQSQAERNIGFYSENEFDLRNLKRLVENEGGQLLELGRSCIARTHRSFTVINLLWAAIAQFARHNRVSYMFGCGSLHSSDLRKVSRTYAYLRTNHFAPKQFRVYPLESCRMKIDDDVNPEAARRDELRNLSPILKGYLRAGAMICGEPAYDAEFGTADVLVLMETAKINQRYKQHYGMAAART